jgi:hypothetical protein
MEGVEGRESVKGSSIFTGLTTGLIIQTTRDSNMKRRRCDESGMIDGVERGMSRLGHQDKRHGVITGPKPERGQIPASEMCWGTGTKGNKVWRG